MVMDNIMAGVAVTVLALFGVGLFAGSIYARSVPRPRSHAVTRAERPKQSARPYGPYRRAA